MYTNSRKNLFSTLLLALLIGAIFGKIMPSFHVSADNPDLTPPTAAAAATVAVATPQSNLVEPLTGSGIEVVTDFQTFRARMLNGARAILIFDGGLADSGRAIRYALTAQEYLTLPSGDSVIELEGEGLQNGYEDVSVANIETEFQNGVYAIFDPSINTDERH